VRRAISSCPMTGPNPLHPDQLSVSERLAEIADILARALIRLKVRQSRPIPGNSGDSSLDFLADQSGHANDACRGEARG
jgi:hypothetical protein